MIKRGIGLLLSAGVLLGGCITWVVDERWRSQVLDQARADTRCKEMSILSESADERWTRYRLKGCGEQHVYACSNAKGSPGRMEREDTSRTFAASCHALH